MDELRAIVEAATPGPWTHAADHNGVDALVVDQQDDFVADCLGAQFKADARFIATFNPERVSQMLERDRLLTQLVIESYEGERPTNSWRKKAEDLGAWPGAALDAAPLRSEAVP